MNILALKFLSLKNEMEWALRDLELKIPEDVRIGEAAVEEIKRNVEAYIWAVTKLASSFMTGMTKRSTMKIDEVKIATEAISRANIEIEIQRKRERDRAKIHSR